jgi:DNA-binding NtrC family response regulator
MSSRRVLVVDDESLIRWSLGERLRADGHDVLEAATAAEALRHAGHGVDLVLLDYKLPDEDGLSVLRQLRELDPDVLVIMLTAHTGVEIVVEAMRAGAFDYATKPFDLDDVALRVSRALETTRLRRELRTLRDTLSRPFGPGSIIGESEPIVRLKGLVRRIATSPGSTVLITGESGTGKDLIAKVIHYASSRAARPFLNITCSALPDTLLESELFGYERGAFTDARQQKRGLLEQGDEGTVFLDEIGEMAPPLQAKLLRVLEEKAFRRVGGTGDVRVDVRVIAATNRYL